MSRNKSHPPRAYLPAVIVRATCQIEQVDRLVRHCNDLDGTKLIVLDNPDTTTPRPQCQTDALHLALAAMQGRPFVWLEADSIPLKSGWLAAISSEYKKIGKPFLLPDMSECDKSDIAAAIGVYPGEAHYLIPKQFPKHAWDAWLNTHMQPVIGRTRLIQHNFGKYFMGKAAPWEFPRDKAIIRPETLIFHKDSAQSLIDCFKDSPYILDLNGAAASRRPGAPLFRHSGDIGDIIAALPILRAMGGGDMVLFHDPDAPLGMCARESLEGARYEALKPLLEAQPYVYSVSWGTGVSTKGFREILRPRFESLVERQARHVGHWPIDLRPWLRVPGEIEEHKRIICCRSPRYRGSVEFPWKEAAQAYGDRLLFVGLPDEHKDFEVALGRRVEFAKTDNFLDIAKLMAGAPQVIANQSAPLWVALGLGKKVIVEGNPTFPNTQVPRPGSFWAYTEPQMQMIRKAFLTVAERAK